MSGWGDWLALVLVVAIVYLLVRPSSKAAEMVDAFGRLMIGLVKSATDLANG